MANIVDRARLYWNQANDLYLFTGEIINLYQEYVKVNTGMYIRFDLFFLSVL